MIKKLLALILVSIFIASPLKVVFASETDQATEAPTDTAPTVSSTLLSLIPVYLFAGQNGGALAVTPVAKDLFVWAYATSTESAEVGFATSQGSEGSEASSTEAENSPFTPVGVLIFAVTPESVAPVAFSQSGEGVGLAATSTYGYDPFGQRVKMTVATGTSVTTYYPTKGYNITGSVPTKHIFLPDGTMIATIVGTGTSSVVSYIHTDHLTGSNVVTNSSGSVVELSDYYPYGNSRLDEQSGFSEQRKAFGHEFDPSTNLSYQDARYYNPSNGKFLSQDPAFLAIGDGQRLQAITQKKLAMYLADPQNLNSYSYARDNPLLYNDPTGQYWNPFNSINAGWFVSVGNVANSYAQYDPVFNYATNHVGVAYAVGGVGLAAGAGATALAGASALGIAGAQTLAGTCIAFCNQAGQEYTAAVDWAASRGISASSLPTQSEIQSVSNYWANTNFDSKAQAILYHFNEHADGSSLQALTQNGQNVWNAYVNNSSSVQKVTQTLLANGSQGLKINLAGGAGGIFNQAGQIVSTWAK